MRIPGNFDRWMFNYKEGNLSPEEKDYFETFMLNDAQYEDDIEAWDNAYVRNQDFKYERAAMLQKTSFFQRHGKWAALALLLLTTSAGVFYFGQSNEALYALRTETGHFLTDYDQTIAATQPAAQSISRTGHSNAFLTTSSQQIQSGVLNGMSMAIGTIGRSGEHEQGQYMTQAENYSNETDFETTRINYLSSTPQTYNELDIERGKVDNSSSKYSSVFKSNPTFVKDKKTANLEKLKRGSIFMYKFKQAFRKIERRSGYPLAIVNLKDPEIIIPDKNLLAFNPGFTGSMGSFRIGADYRNQWLGKDVNSQNSTIYFDNYVPALKGGVGASINYSDYNYGSFQNYVASLYYSYKFEVVKNVFIEPGVKFSLGMTSQNTEKIVSDSYIEMDRGRVLPTYESGNQSEANYLWYKDYGVGIVINAERFYIGASVDNIAQHDQTIFTADKKLFIESPRLFTAITGFDFQSRDKKKLLSPFLSYYQYGPKTEAWVGLSTQLNWFTIGASYSTNKEYAASVGLKFKSFRLNYQVDYLESEFLQKSFVSHNIGIRFSAKNKAIR